MRISHPATRSVVGLAILVAAFVAATVFIAAFPPTRFLVSLVTMSGSSALDDLVPADPRFRLTPELRGNTLVGTGRTTVPDGTRVQMWAESWSDAADFTMSISTAAVVRDGQFEASFDVTGWPAGSTAITALMTMDDDQPAALSERFGADGARMSGPSVRYDDDTGLWALEDWQVVQLAR